jgi:eukaryotic-like serine/threonine-protein kinase
MPETVIAGRYRLDELLGRSGMSEVWCAEDLELGRRVAIKLLAPDADTARFEREARAFASLAHPNVTQLYDYGEAEGRPYMVLEYVPGGTLEDRLHSGRPLPDTEAWAIAAGIASGLAHAHARGVIHRDLKPANVLFDEEGRPKLADFGIARMTVGEGTLTEAGTMLGTAAYISPEQAAGEPASAASDVYSFGVILYRMLTGRLPFESPDPLRLALQHRDATPPPISALRSDAPPVLEATASAALAKDPRARPADGAAVLSALGIAPAAGTTAAPPLAEAETAVLPLPSTPRGTAVTYAEPPPPPPRRRRLPLLVAALLVLVLGGGVLAYAVTRSSSSPGDTASVTTPTLTSRPHTTTAGSTTAPTTTAATTTAPATAAETATTRPQTTTARPPTTTAPTTTAPTTTAATTTTTPTTATTGTTTPVTTTGSTATLP